MAFFTCGKNKHVEIDFVHLKLALANQTFTAEQQQQHVKMQIVQYLYSAPELPIIVIIVCFDCRRLTKINDNKRLFVFS